MKKKLIISFVFIISLLFQVSAQIPVNTLVKIIKAEDELRFDITLKDLLNSKNAPIRKRAALAAGRIGDERAIFALVNLLNKDKDTQVRAKAAFALGEIESLKAADAILETLQNTKEADEVRARAVEAAGKIAAANAKDEKAKNLGKAILNLLQSEDNRGKLQNREAVLLGITAILRAKPEQGEAVAAKFLTNTDARIRADAANTLSRLRAKNAGEKLRRMLLSDDDPIARANAARALGAAEEKEAFDILLAKALSDEDLRVRVSAVRSLGNLKDKQAADKLLDRGENLLADYKKSKFANPVEKNELLEIAATLGKILPETDGLRAVKFLDDLHEADNYSSAETEIALARIAPETYLKSIADQSDEIFNGKWQSSSAAFQGLGEIANLTASEENNSLKSKTRLLLIQLIGKWISQNPQIKAENKLRLAIPDLLKAFAAFKSENTSNIFRLMPETEPDVFIRAAIAEILGEQPANKENFEALKTAFAKALLNDKQYNDAQLAILSALVKIDKMQAVSSLKLALDAPDYLVRRHAADLIKENNLTKEVPIFEEKVGTIKPFNPQTETKLGQILNTNADYIRAVSRKSASAAITTEKGVFTIEFFPEDAPLTVDNFIKLAKTGYFNNVAIHRVVPNFVVQDGDPRGDGNGGPGWEIRDEINEIPYERGTVGMALSGKNTGGSQWFITHSPQPHLDGGYTVFGKVNETDMKIVDKIVRGDKILNVKIVEIILPQKQKSIKRKPVR